MAEIEKVKVLISARIREKEFGRRILEEDLACIARSARAALATPLAGRGLPSGTRLLKAYATSRRGPKRIVYLLVVDDDDLFLLFYRGKNDPLGRNASMNNPAFRTALDKYLALLEQDVVSGKIEQLNAGRRDEP